MTFPRIIIRAVPQRKPCVEYLLTRLPMAEVSWDIERDNRESHAGCRLGYLQAFRLAAGEPCLMLEDDITLTKDFLAKVKPVIDAHPKNLIQFFSLRKADLTKGSRWDARFLMGQCFYLPAYYSLHLINYLPTWQAQPPEHKHGADSCIRDWLLSRREKYWLHVPSLVQHRVGPSAIDYKRPHTRQSPSFVEPDE